MPWLQTFCQVGSIFLSLTRIYRIEKSRRRVHGCLLLQRYLSQGVTYLRKYFCDELNAFWAVPGHVVV